ncbi:unnamed protein product [Bursaphelenchus okinawaensis]|uniref:Uncharacterized protein n=1 Tax=Bursaphelenchus okinawaensis TaxID=465554 RepID=A0A811KR27_9BILA|nr:unnamed protein product [Bursaphelenchus okinawaensis]CAG9107539.1 unnamed protein product [Bursaphelenchus okinawaensis]
MERFCYYVCHEESYCHFLIFQNLCVKPIENESDDGSDENVQEPSGTSNGPGNANNHGRGLDECGKRTDNLCNQITFRGSFQSGQRDGKVFYYGEHKYYRYYKDRYRCAKYFRTQPRCKGEAMITEVTDGGFQAKLVKPHTCTESDVQPSNDKNL